MDKDSKIPRGRGLTFVSLGFIVFILGEGSIGDNITFALIGLTLGNPEVLYWLAWIALFWSAWRFWVVNPKPFIYLQADIHKSMDVTTAEVVPSILKLTQSVFKDDETCRHRFHKVEFKWLNLDTVVYHIDKVDGRLKGQTKLTLTIFDGVLWKVKHTVKALTQADGFAESFVPYILFISALLLAAWKL